VTTQNGGTQAKVSQGGTSQRRQSRGDTD